MAKIHNKKFENALNGVAQAVPPIWFMRQAGRYHAHYQERRAKHSFMDLCKKPELAAEVALGPVEDFDFDVSILFSDLLFPLESLGMGLDYNPAPSLAWNLDQTTIGKLANPDEAIAGVEFQAEALHKTREVLPDDKSLIGFVGGPWTLFGYAVEGSHKGGLIQTKANLSLWPKFCEKMVPFLKKNIALQADPTLVYALGDFTIKRVLNEHKKIESPYNTYKYAGLPPGPINMPSIHSIDAVLNYERHKYYYFCAKEDFSGYHNFATNLDDHLRNARVYQAALNRARLYR